LRLQIILPMSQLCIMNSDQCILANHNYELFNDHYKNLPGLSSTSRLFNHIINSYELKSEFSKKLRNDVRTFFSNGRISLFVTSLTGNRVDIKVNPTDTVSHCQTTLEFFTGIPHEKVKLIYAGWVLEDDKLLSDYKISKDTKIHRVLDLKRHFRV
jgi:hypothetical protein